MYLISRENVRALLEEWVDQKEIERRFGPEVIEYLHVVILHDESPHLKSIRFIPGVTGALLERCSVKFRTWPRATGNQWLNIWVCGTTKNTMSNAIYYKCFLTANRSSDICRAAMASNGLVNQGPSCYSLQILKANML